MAKSPIIYNGKKAKLIPQISPLYPNTIENYYEPFCGGASIFFDLFSQQIINGDYYLSDLNWRVLRIYEVIRDDLGGLNVVLQSFLQYDPELLFYTLRKIKDAPDQKNRPAPAGFKVPFNPSKTWLAAKDLFLNRMTTNGWRENKSGQFNLPYDKRRTSGYFYQATNLADCNKVFSDPRVHIKVEDYLKIEPRLVSGDFVYLDPPYEPASKTANFTSYTCNAFGQQEQRQLANFINRIDAKGVKFVLSNSLAASSLYTNPKFNIKQIQVRAYKSNSPSRFEILVNN